MHPNAAIAALHIRCGNVIDIRVAWTAILSRLKSILETGRPLEIPFAALQFKD
jgi:hypothetical protein